MKHPHFRLIAYLTLVLSLLWIIFMILTMTQSGTIKTPESAVGYAQSAGWLHYANYINAALITIFATAFFAGLDHFLKESTIHPFWRRIGFVFIPVYATLNLVVYLSQVTILPSLAASLAIPAEAQFAAWIIPMFTQTYQPSFIAFLNTLAYAVLGIPSIIFGILFTREFKMLKSAGILLALNGIACLLSLIGVIAQIQPLTLGSILGGVLFIASIASFVISIPKLESKSSKHF